MPSCVMSDVTTDSLLDGRVSLLQPRKGHRAGTDAVLLAAAAPVRPGDRVIDVGAATGAVGLMVAAREKAAHLVFVERDPDLAELCRQNSRENGVDAAVVVADVLDRAARRAAGLSAESADLVLTNPPFLEEGRSRLSPDPGRSAAHALPAGGLEAWLAACMALLRPGGRLVLIHRADRLGECLAATSLDWLRVLRPAGLAVAVATYAFRPASLLRPLASGFDSLIEARGRNPLSLNGEPTGVRVEDSASEKLAEIIPELSRSFALYPDWNSPPLALLLSHAEAKERYGKTYRQIVYSHAGRPVGCYIFFARRGEIARVLQVLALPDYAGVTLDSLFHQAATLGCVGVRGRVDAGVMEALIARRCLLFHGSAMVVHARDKALLEEVRNAPALLTGLAGESWTRFVGGEFA